MWRRQVVPVGPPLGESALQPAASAAPNEPEGCYLNELEWMAGLRDQGMISREEFEAGLELIAEGFAEVATGVALEEAAEDIAAEGVAEIAEGATELGAAAAAEADDGSQYAGG